MTESTVRRIHKPAYNEANYPPMPASVRLAAACWERVWWLTLIEPNTNPEALTKLCERFSSETVTVRSKMRTHREMCFAITTQALEEQNEFEVAMMMMAHIDKNIGTIERIEGKPSALWPLEEFKV